MISLHRNETEIKLEIQDISTDILNFLEDSEVDSDVLLLKTDFFLFMKNWEKWLKIGTETPGDLCNLQEIKSTLEVIVWKIVEFREKSTRPDSNHVLKEINERYCSLFHKIESSLECVNVFLEKHPDEYETKWLQTISFTKKKIFNNCDSWLRTICLQKLENPHKVGFSPSSVSKFVKKKKMVFNK